jgi:hypothetical protein
MAAINDITITNTGNSKTFLFRTVGRLKVRTTGRPIQIPLPNSAPSVALLFRFIGQAREISFDFGLFNDGVDVSNGTESGTITTIQEQIEYLEDTIFRPNFDDGYTFTCTEHRSGTQTGLIADVEIDHEGGSPNFKTGTINFSVGTTS